MMNKKEYQKRISIIKDMDSCISHRSIKYLNGEASIFYIKELTDRISLSEQVIKPLVKSDKNAILSAENIIENVIFADDCKLESDFDKEN